MHKKLAKFTARAAKLKFNRELLRVKLNNRGPSKDRLSLHSDDQGASKHSPPPDNLLCTEFSAGAFDTLSVVLKEFCSQVNICANNPASNFCLSVTFTNGTSLEIWRDSESFAGKKDGDTLMHVSLEFSKTCQKFNLRVSYCTCLQCGLSQRDRFSEELRQGAHPLGRLPYQSDGVKAAMGFFHLDASIPEYLIEGGDFAHFIHSAIEHMQLTIVGNHQGYKFEPGADQIVHMCCHNPMGTRYSTVKSPHHLFFQSSEKPDDPFADPSESDGE